MSRFAALTVALVVAVTLAAANRGPANIRGFRSAPNYVVDLADPPEKRWYDAVRLVIKNHGWEYTFAPFLKHYGGLADLPAEYADGLEETLKSRFPDSHKEIKGIYKAITDMGYGDRANMSFYSKFPFFYEISHVTNFESKFPASLRRSCTGILSLPEDKSLSMIHGRNLDESPHSSRNLTLNVTVNRNGTYLYSFFDYTWITTGVYTASMLGGLTLEENWRHHQNPTAAQSLELLAKKNAVPIALLFRHVMENQLSFTEAVHWMTTTTLAAPGYIIMSAPGRQGAILSLSINQSTSVTEYLNDTSSVTFKVQTNYDRWLPDPPTDPRRTVAQNALTTVGRRRSGSEMGVWMALSTYPVHNPGTEFTVLMRTDRVPEGYVRVAMIPDPNAS